MSRQPPGSAAAHRTRCRSPGRRGSTTDPRTHRAPRPGGRVVGRLRNGGRAGVGPPYRDPALAPSARALEVPAPRSPRPTDLLAPRPPPPRARVRGTQARYNLTQPRASRRRRRRPRAHLPPPLSTAGGARRLGSSFLPRSPARARRALLFRRRAPSLFCLSFFLLLALSPFSLASSLARALLRPVHFFAPVADPEGRAAGPPRRRRGPAPWHAAGEASPAR